MRILLLLPPMTETELRQACARATGRDASDTTVERLAGGAGNRVYWRISWPQVSTTVRAVEDGDASLEQSDAPRSLVVMQLPPEPGKSEEASHEAAASVELPFLNVRRYLEQIGVRVPHIFLDEHATGLVVLEDLTDRTLEQALLDGGDRRTIYGRAVEQLAKLRAHAELHPDPKCLAWTRAFDFELYQWEFEHFIEWGLLGRGAVPTEVEMAELRTAFTEVSRELAAAPRSFTHRDYQSRNIMVLDSGEQVVIDFQDALQGPRQYDLVALLRDSYVEIPRDLIDELLALYRTRFEAEGGPKLEAKGFDALFDLLTVQRKLKDAGRFVFIDQVKMNPSFLKHIPSSLGYVKAALARVPRLAIAAEILARHVPELR
jgi:aminoglycoside/choline kinase family phosphotransferase